jgi:hypothetical protein
LDQSCVPPVESRRIRRLPRYRTDLRLTVTVLGGDGHFETHGLCNQIGEAGLGGIISNELSIGEVVNLQLYLFPPSPPLHLRAIVRWRSRLQHGFEFFAISEELSAQIREFCKSLSGNNVAIG